MPADIQDVKQVAEELGAKFDEFKQKNDKRVEALEAEKGKLVEQVETLNEKLGQLDDMKSALEKELAGMKRPDGTGTKAASEHKAAFMQFVRKGIDTGLGELQAKALQIGVDADGGYAVPEELDRNIIELLRDESPMRQVCNQITVGTPDYKRLVNLGGAGSGWVGETAPRPETSTPTLAQINAVMGELYANPQATQTSLDDMFFDAEGWLNSEVGREFSEKEGSAFLLGDGVDKPKGLLAYPFAVAGDKTRPYGTLQRLVSGNAGALNGDNLIDLVQAVKAGYRRAGVWMMNNLTVAYVRKLKDSEGNYLWRPGLEVGQPSSLLGYGITENEDMPDIAADANALAFGDFKRAYTIVDRIGTRVLRDPYTNKPYVGFYTTKRVGGMLVDSQAVKVLTLSAA
ncbi:TPA: phage major capsid protein [Pseudomonas aeruginosa]|uniref:phage major capsid protein n=1 Tax=Pseudomonas aeruginosa TaxID=287 RepID=UPI00188CB668|nr:phage major capsid protein [Pseudomonas aeruginosa]MBF2931847.1 phage major capsid protein [Pseudomonas aeruginosa]MDT1089209.1 phage major capsid protein [Pseudomonas aeruginosa]HBO0188195.1 phage major capsid protein [Pseudomonas aeruginosa]HBP1907858.1 phage major capsid protein [Pseudomonas aeruginosa]HCE7488830.1 phage major capsid protein [Pseudomonas aeruginosa]